LSNELSRAELEELGALGRRHPARWIRHALGVDLWSIQKQITASVRDNRNTLVDSCHGIGKTKTLASIGLDFLYSYPGSRVIATAPTFRQVQSILFAEVHMLHQGAQFELGGTLNQVELGITEGWYFHGMSTNRAERFQGQHAPGAAILFIVDEGYGVSTAIFEAIRGGMSSGFARLLVAGNPTDPGAWVAEASRKTGDNGQRTWNHIQVSAFDTPNFTELGITIEDMRSGAWREKQDRWLEAHGELPRPYLINPDFVAEALIEFGEDSPAWQARILGQLPSESVNTVIPLSWVEAAMARSDHSMAVDKQKAAGILPTMEELVDYVPCSEPEELGVDVAGFGDDDSVIAPRRGRRCLALLVYRKMDTRAVAGLVDAAHAELLKLTPPVEEGEAKPRRLLIKVDSNGIGAGVVADLGAMHHEVQGVNVSEAPSNRRRFADRTTELWWWLRELLHPLNPAPIAIPRDNKLLGELSGRRYRLNKGDLLQLESKEDFKKRLGRSPDKADAVVLSYAPSRVRANIRSL
jgi:phage terminase large subunit